MSQLDTSIHTLKLPYTYTITADGKKADSRAQLCGMVTDILTTMRDELLKEGVTQYLMSKGYTLAEAKEIVDGKREGSPNMLGGRTEEGSATGEAPTT